MFTFKGVRYKDILCIDDLQIADEGITCLIGKSGGGKTTLLKILNKLLSPTDGGVFYRGKSLDEIDSVDHRKAVMMLRQKPHMFSGTVKDNLLFATSLHGIDVTDEVLQEALDSVQLKAALSQDAKSLSGGEAQRLALARIMLLKPECILLDEPSSALDDDTEQFIIEKIVEHAKTNKIVLVMVTHSKQVARSYGDYVYEVTNGRIAEVKLDE